MLSHFFKSHKILETLQLIYIKTTKHGAFHQINQAENFNISAICYFLAISVIENCSQRHKFVPYESQEKFKEIPYELVSALNLDEMTAMYKEEAPCLFSCANSDTVFLVGRKKKDPLFTLFLAQLCPLVLSNPFHDNLVINHIIRSTIQHMKILFHHRVKKQHVNYISGEPRIYLMESPEFISAEQRRGIQIMFTFLQILFILLLNDSSSQSRSVSA